MRKYQQLLLIIISVISIISLVQYRNEYLRLRYVLQVLNFFGSPNNIIDNNCISLNESFVNSEANFYKYSDPSPLWFNFEKHYLYSAFWEIKDPDSGRKAVKILAVGEESSFRNYQCRIWFDEGNTVKSKDGEFTYQMVSRSSSSEVFYYLYCEAPPVTEFDGFPYGVLLTSDSGVKRFVPIFVQPHDTNTIVACVKPDLTALPKFSIVEFMIYYNIIGVQVSVYPLVHNPFDLKGKNWLLLLHFQMEHAKNKQNKSTTLVLGWDEYLVPKSLTSLSGLIQGDTSTKYETKTLACCTEMNDDKAAEKTWPTSLRKTRCIPQTKRAVLYHHPNVRSPMQKEELPPASLSLHIYRTCDPEEKHVKLIYEPVMAKYLGKFIAHKLMALWNSGSLVRHHAVHLQGINLSSLVS
ncbi:uncharacterized protein LOC103519174 [Diaphorina citri]|uniref:Uncharacterized protein LOC103519174 n=1 Tax=Diaphorina citri TaxID=121845 RepID=A0A3Q0JIJ2_DIACI|nr:uncharacterized protein LOC103519174 [Diaphorina citri]